MDHTCFTQNISNILAEKGKILGRTVELYGLRMSSEPFRMVSSLYLDKASTDMRSLDEYTSDGKDQKNPTREIAGPERIDRGMDLPRDWRVSRQEADLKSYSELRPEI